jgi:AcrR family transcriptional regulator
MAKTREERRHQILDAALEEFSVSGYHATKVSDIVARAGVAQGTFYLYFKDKRSIFDELLGLFFDELSNAITRIDITQPVFPQIRLNVRRVLETLANERKFTKLLVLDAVGLDPSLDQRLLAFWGEVTARISAPLREGQEMGLVRQGDVGLVAVMIVGAFKELILQRLLKEEHPDLAPIEQAIIDYNLFGVLLGPPMEDPGGSRGG